MVQKWTLKVNEEFIMVNAENQDRISVQFLRFVNENQIAVVEVEYVNPQGTHRMEVDCPKGVAQAIAPKILIKFVKKNKKGQAAVFIFNAKGWDFDPDKRSNK